MNKTIRKFGHPGTLIRDYEHWVVLLRPSQPTLGSLVLAAKSDATALSALDPAAFAELARVTSDIERALDAAVSYQKMNYLMLMMVDPHVHYHVIPRYEGAREHGGRSFPDIGWPKLPSLSDAAVLDADEIGALAVWLRSLWPVSRAPSGR